MHEMPIQLIRDTFLELSLPPPINNVFKSTVELVYNDHPRDPKIVTVVDRWSLFRGSFVL